MNMSPPSRKGIANHTVSGGLPPYESLRVAVIEQAINDFKYDLIKVKKSKRESVKEQAIDDMKSIIAFFQSQYFDFYTHNISGDLVLKYLVTDEVIEILKG